MNTWWEQYQFAGDIDYLRKFNTEDEYVSRIPYEILIGINRIHLAETTEWSKYFDKYGVWPSVNQWNKAREIKAWKMEDFETMLLLVIKKNVFKIN